MLAAGLTLPGWAGAESDASTLVGTWHVLVHYRDARSSRPEALRWDDRVWVFEPSGSGLRWTEYPLVVFRDTSGRFEDLGTSAARRVVGPWEPNEAQWAQIRRGPEVNARGSRSVVLRGSDAQGWRSGDRARPASASAITYTQTWTIEGLPERPVFARLDALGSARAEGLEGLTRYATTGVERDGALLRGSFVRDDTRSGTFRMLRAGPVRDAAGSGKTQAERLREHLAAELESEPDEVSRELEELLERGGTLEDVSEGVREGEIGR